MKYERNKITMDLPGGSLLKGFCGNVVQRTTTQRDIIRINFTDEGIGGSSEHLDELDAIRSAGPEDMVILYFTGCPGGVINTGMAIMNALIETPAHTVAVIEGSNASLATMIPLVCSEIVVTPYASWMLHSAQGGDYGTMVNKERSAVFASKLMSDFMSDVYEGFLSEEEIKDLKNGLEIYLSSDEIEERLIARKDSMIADATLICQDVVAEKQQEKPVKVKKTKKKD